MFSMFGCLAVDMEIGYVAFPLLKFTDLFFPSLRTGFNMEGRSF